MINVITPEFVSWFQKIEELVKAERPNAKLEFKNAIKYIKIIEHSFGQRSVFAFINKENGDILKPAAWNIPAKHARGNIFDEYNGLQKMTAYGPRYLR